jgi:hypothetical protein
MAGPHRPYRHPAAWTLLTYTAENGRAEQVWNGRDGPVPVTITLRDGTPAIHRRWTADEPHDPGWTPPPGTRRFTDLTPATARTRAEHAFDTWAADPRWTGPQITAIRDRAVTALAAQMLEYHSVPDLTEEST